MYQNKQSKLSNPSNYIHTHTHTHTKTEIIYKFSKLINWL